MALVERSRFAKITVTFERRDDGGLRVFSDDVPGFVLSHADPHAVLDDVVPALETILSEMLGVSVSVSPLPTLDDLAEAGVIAEPPSQRRSKREYVGQLAVA